MAVCIKAIESGSPAEKAGLKAGMMLLSLSGHEISDGLDYEFYSAKEKLCATVLDENKLEKVFNINKKEYEQLGCVFESYLIDKHHSCKNKCVFCFVDQLPKGLREPLYFKDDDERLSFLFGNYVTLTNLSEHEINRIIEMKISPINISVHTTNPELRVLMMGNKNAGEVLNFIPKLAKAGISINTQLVLCPGLNDGNELIKSIEWLAQWRPALQSIAVVPVGLSKHRKGLYPLQTYTKQTAKKQLEIMLKIGDELNKNAQGRLVYPSDEWFLKAQQELPDEEFYDGFLQLENGVGMWRLFENEFMQELLQLPKKNYIAKADIVTGVLAAPLIQKLANALETKFKDVKIKVHIICNDFFGAGITVAGLLTGADIISQMKGKIRAGRLLLPEVVLRAQGDKLLDETTPQEIAEALDVEIEIVPQGGHNLLAAILFNYSK